MDTTGSGEWTGIRLREESEVQAVRMPGAVVCSGADRTRLREELRSRRSRYRMRKLPGRCLRGNLVN